MLERPEHRSHLRRLAAQLAHLFALLLWAGAALALAAGMMPLTIAIAIVSGIVILVNAGFAFVQEYRAERAADALRDMLPPSARVLRDGLPQEIRADEVVPGDLLVLESGDGVRAHRRDDRRRLHATPVRSSSSSVT